MLAICSASGHEEDLLKVRPDPGDSGESSKVRTELIAAATYQTK
jgi:hypothetical protein